MNKSKFLLHGANAYAKWAFITCWFIQIADFVFIIAFIGFDIIAKNIFSMLFIMINTFFVIQILSILYSILDADFIVLKKLSETIVTKYLFEKFIKFKTFTFKDIIGLINIFFFSVSVAGGLHIILTFVLWLIIDKFNYQITFLSNLQHWVYHHYPLLCLYIFGYVLSLYAIKIYYLWKTDSDLKKFLDIFPSWKKILKEHNR